MASIDLSESLASLMEFQRRPEERGFFAKKTYLDIHTKNNKESLTIKELNFFGRFLRIIGLHHRSIRIAKVSDFIKKYQDELFKRTETLKVSKLKGKLYRFSPIEFNDMFFSAAYRLYGKQIKKIESKAAALKEQLVFFEIEEKLDDKLKKGKQLLEKTHKLLKKQDLINEEIRKAFFCQSERKYKDSQAFALSNRLHSLLLKNTCQILRQKMSKESQPLISDFKRECNPKINQLKQHFIQIEKTILKESIKQNQFEDIHKDILEKYHEIRRPYENLKKLIEIDKIHIYNPLEEVETMLQEIQDFRARMIKLFAYVEEKKRLAQETLTNSIENIREAIDQSFLNQELIPRLSYSDKRKAQENDSCALLKKVNSKGYKKLGFIFLRTALKGGSFKNIYLSEGVFFDEESDSFRKKSYILSTAKPRERDHIGERRALRKLFKKDGVRAMPDRLCDYSSGKRQPQKFTFFTKSPRRKKIYNAYKYYEKGNLEENFPYFRENRKRLLDCSMDIVTNIRAAHREGQFHGDLAPKNLLIDSQYHVVLMDIAGAFDEEDCPGTLFYIPLSSFGNVSLTPFQCQLIDIFSCIRCFEELLSPQNIPRIQNQRGYTSDLDSIRKFHPNNKWDKIVYTNVPLQLFAPYELEQISHKAKEMKNQVEELVKDHTITKESVASMADTFQNFLISLES